MDRSSSSHDSPPSREQSRYRPAVIVSAVAHLILAILLFYWYWPAGSDSDLRESVTTATGAESNPSSGAQRNAPPAAPAVDPEVPPEQIARSVEAQISEYASIPDERKLTELEKNLKRLESVASPESVEQTATVVASSLGLDTEQYATKEPAAEGRFDAKTAQLKDVSRRKTESGAWKYESILVDAQGRTMTVEMDAAQGETTFNTFEQLKQYPMAQSIYQSVVMPLMQRMLEAETVAKHIEAEAKKLETQERER